MGAPLRRIVCSLALLLPSSGVLLLKLPKPRTCQSRPTAPRKAAPVMLLLLMSYTSKPPVLELRNSMSVVSLPKKSPSVTNAQVVVNDRGDDGLPTVIGLEK